VIGKFFRMRLLSILPLGISLLGCTQQNAAQSPAPEIVLQAIPAADSAKVERIRDMRTWRNPYLIIQPGGVALLDAADSAEIKLKPAELLPALAALPASNWPYGRVVAATENTPKASEQDSIAIRRNKGIVGGILESAHIAIKWVPST
jgi:hypothetical protein